MSIVAFVLLAFFSIGDAERLVQLEAALVADPDNLRHASEYRQLVIRVKQYDRCIDFFDKLVAEHRQAANAYLNYGFAYVDKIPDAGAITQVILANQALSLFTKSLELKRTWIGLYTRGNSYLYWPRIFNRTKLGVADLEGAMKMQKAESRKSYHVRTYISLGDGYWKLDETAKARAVWEEGLKLFPGNAALNERLGKKDDENLKTIINDTYDPNRRVNTSLEELWLEE